MSRTSLLAAAFALISALAPAETDFSVGIEPEQGDNFAAASFTLHTPGLEDVRYILVLVPGYKGNGASMADQAGWREFAKRTNGAIVACSYMPVHVPSLEERVRKDRYAAVLTAREHYAAAQCGSGKALEDAIEQFHLQAPQYNLKDLPLLIYGRSAGGQFAYGFSCYRPRRMIGFAALKGGYYYPDPVEGTYDVPGLIVSGENDTEIRRRNIRQLFESHRTNGAPWCWLEEKNSGHGEEKSVQAAMAFFEELLALRLPDRGTNLTKIKPGAGVTVNLKTMRVVANIEEAGGVPIEETGWLPSADACRIWQILDDGTRKYVERGP